MKPLKHNVTDKEVAERLQSIEWQTVKDTGYSKISGGFATADIFDQDEEYFDVELKYGVKSDCQSTVYVEQYKMDRITLKIVN